MNKNIKVGIYNWAEFPVANNYYPEDLPADWRLSYFSNDFETACISLSLQSLNRDLLFEWVEDLPDNFELSFALMPPSQFELLTELIHQTGLKIKYLIVDAQERDILLQNNIYKAVLLKAGISKPQQIIAATTMWTPERPVNSSNIALMPDIDDNRLYREWIELWLLENNQQDLTLWLEGTTVQYSTPVKLRTLVELMGY